MFNGEQNNIGMNVLWLLNTTVYLIQKEKQKGLMIDSAKKLMLGVTMPTLAFQMEDQNHCPHNHFVNLFTAVCWFMFSTRGTSICRELMETRQQIMATCNQFMAMYKPSMAMTGKLIYLTQG